MYTFDVDLMDFCRFTVVSVISIQVSHSRLHENKPHSFVLVIVYVYVIIELYE